MKKLFVVILLFASTYAWGMAPTDIAKCPGYYQSNSPYSKINDVFSYDSLTRSSEAYDALAAELAPLANDDCQGAIGVLNSLFSREGKFGEYLIAHGITP